MKPICISIFCLLAFHSPAQFKNIRLAEGEGPMDPTIAISTKNAGIIVSTIGKRAVFSQDGGNTWNESTIDSPLGFAGVPSLISDIKGHLYFFHESDPGGGGPKSDTWADQLVCQKSDDAGKTWSPGIGIGINPPKDQRHAAPAVHPRRPIIYLMWSQFDTYGSTDKNCQSNIMYSMSTNAGSKWTKPVQVSQTPGDCQDDDNTASGAVPAIALDGRIYSVWANQGIIFFDRSYDGGEMWLSNDIGIAKQHAGWSMKVPGFARTTGKPVLTIDDTEGKTHGSLYVVYADQNSDEDTDIFFVRSTSRGDSWTKPVRINEDASGKHQFLPTMALDQVTGHIYIVYYDRRAYDDLQTDVYLAYSFDGGNKFKETKISETPFTATEIPLQLAYMNIVANDGIIIPVWTRTDAGKVSVWTSIIKEADLDKK